MRLDGRVEKVLLAAEGRQDLLQTENGGIALTGSVCLRMNGYLARMTT